MVASYRKAYVYVRNLFSGILQETEEGYSFSYDKQYLLNELATPVSLTLPLKEDIYFSKTMFSFFDGLIPEGWLLDIVVRNWKIQSNDRFGLLLISCKDSIGNVTIREEML
jgi:serine/threonine-protein kinase HipA